MRERFCQVFGRAKGLTFFSPHKTLAKVYSARRVTIFSRENSVPYKRGLMQCGMYV